MGRQPRVVVDGGYYHIVTRGNDRRKLFRCKRDYDFFLKVIKRYLLKFQVSIIHYCLMPNHVHILVRADRAGDLSKFMQGILQVYAMYFRREYGSSGFIFQNRYKSMHIDSDSYLLDCGRYIERNPLRAGLAVDLSDFVWSSARFYAQGAANGIIKSANPLYLELAGTKDGRRKRYAQRLLEARPYEHIVDKEFRI